MIPLQEYGISNFQKKLKKIAVARLGRRKPTGMFDKIAEKAAKKYGSEEIGKKVAAAIYWKKVKAAKKK